eukprot:6055685-Pyramimonas_sp.AAC.1
MFCPSCRRQGQLVSQGGPGSNGVAPTCQHDSPSIPVGDSGQHNFHMGPVPPPEVPAHHVPPPE